MQKLLVSLSIIFIGLILGYIIQRLVLNETIKWDKSLTKERRLLQNIALLVLNPIATIGAIWMLEFDSIQIILMPFICIIAIATGGITALILSKILKYNPRKTGSFFTISSLSNIGSVGALIVFIFLGEEAFALVPMYKLFETIVYYAICFPIAKSFSPSIQKKDSSNKFIRVIKFFLDPFVVVSVGGVIVGIALNFSGIKRPEIYSDINAIAIPIMSLCLLMSIGMAMKFSRVKEFIKPSLLTAAIKFLIVPFVSTGIAYLLGFGTIDNGLPLKVILIVTSMPIGFVALVPPSIYDLDLDFANAAWMITTALLVLVIPLQMLIASFM